MATIRAIHFKKWAGTTDAQNNFGELIRRLVRAAVHHTKIKDLRFYSAETNQLPGWDGILDCAYEGNVIPDGRSLWELGAGLRNKGKIKSDFAKREGCELPDGWVKKETTFVAATFSKLKDRIKLEKDLKELDGGWKAIKVVDATLFEEWVSPLFAVQGWLQTQGVGLPVNIKSLEHMWSDWSNDTVPPMSPELLTVNRDSEAKELRQFLTGDPGHLKIRSESAEEVIGFVYATIYGLEDEGVRLSHFSRAIVISDPELCRELNTLPPHIILLKGNATVKAMQLAQHGHLVVSAQGNTVTGESVSLTRSIGEEFKKALCAMGVDEQQAEMDARASGFSASIWRVWNLNHYSGGSDTEIEWSEPNHADLVVPVILLGGWSENVEGDKEILKYITGMEYDIFRDKLNVFRQMDHPLLIYVDGVYVVSAPAVAFALCLKHITEGQLQKYHEVLVRVFGEISPLVDLSPDERPFASIHGHQEKYSSWLRDGLAERLLQIVTLGNELALQGKLPDAHKTCQSFADAAMRALPSLGADYRLITSLQNQLPVLMEAAPMPFIEALSQWAQGRRESISPVFAEGAPGFGCSMHTHILWGLETLAWNSAYLTDVSFILCELAAVDPGGNIVNRPINSLKEIFLAWHPGTCATNAEKADVLELIIKKYPEIAWELLNSVLPSHHGVSHQTSKPKWRDFGRSTMPELLNRDVWASYQDYFDKALLMAVQDKDKWPKLLEFYERVGEENQSRLENELNSLCFEQDEEETKLAIWRALRNFIGRHMKFQDAEWAISEDRLEGLQTLLKKFEPVEVNKKSTWLFDDYLPDVPTINHDYEKAEEELARLRREAIHLIWNDGGLANLKNFIDQVKLPQFIAPALIAVLDDVDEIQQVTKVLSGGSNNQKDVARSLSGFACEQYTQDWVDWVFTLVEGREVPPNVAINILRGLPFRMDIFKRIDALDQEYIDTYWREIYFLNSDDVEALKFMIRKAITYERTVEAFTLVNLKIEEVDLDLVLTFFEQFCADIIKKPEQASRVSNLGYYLEKLFEWLRLNPNMDQGELAKMEYQFLPILASRHKHKHLALHELMAKDPIFFVDVLCDVYMPASKRGQKIEKSADTQSELKAKHGWHLLESWKLIPGQTTPEILNGDALFLWVDGVREYAEEKDRAELADQHIGKMLYHAGFIKSDDGLWPHEAVRNVLEHIKSTEIEVGMSIEAVNSRGVTSRAMFEGGNQERQLEKTWRKREAQLRSRCPRAASVCRSIADSWQSYAQREDERAEKDRLRFN